MRKDDVGAVTAISDAVHGDFTEPSSVYAERLELYPAGCFVLEHQDAIAGYLVSHPWLRESSPALGQPLGAIPGDTDTYYLHDIALLPVARGTGAGRGAIALIKAQALTGGFPDITLTAVNGADRFWAAQGFTYDEGGAADGYGEGTYRMRLTLDR
ncbi:MAG TPA: GNAT family N-acetyltransferase [Croceibacterium sp.]|nr:GNAT family N-acetyltransferase [Croceibacterium sp.]